GAFESGGPRHRPAGFTRLGRVFFPRAPAGRFVGLRAPGSASGDGGGLDPPRHPPLGGRRPPPPAAARGGGAGWQRGWRGDARGAWSGSRGGRVCWGAGVSGLALAGGGLGSGVSPAVAAAAVVVSWGREASGRVASRLYTAWCAAGIVLPITAGRLFDVTHGY